MHQCRTCAHVTKTYNSFDIVNGHPEFFFFIQPNYHIFTIFGHRVPIPATGTTTLVICSFDAICPPVRTSRDLALLRAHLRQHAAERYRRHLE